MIDLKDFRENPDKYRHAAEVKRVNVDVDQVLHLDGERLRSQQAFERLRAEQNEANARIRAAWASNSSFGFAARSSPRIAL